MNNISCGLGQDWFFDLAPLGAEEHKSVGCSLVVAQNWDMDSLTRYYMPESCTMKWTWIMEQIRKYFIVSVRLSDIVICQSKCIILEYQQRLI